MRLPLKENIFTATNWGILCDFDGTISSVDVIDILLEQFADSTWQDIEKEWKSGRIGSLECLSKQVQLLDVSRTQLNQCLDSIEIDRHFPSFVVEMEAKGYNITIISDGLDYAIKRILSRYDLGHIPVLANILQQKGSRHWQLAFPNSKMDCEIQSGHCKCASLKRIHDGMNSARSLLIGDGTSDFCVARKVDFVLAKKRLIQHCISHNLPHYPIKSFSDALAVL